MTDNNIKPNGNAYKLPSDFPEAEDSNSWCQTDGDQSVSGLNKSRFVWRIKNFKGRKEQNGEYINSEVFRVNGPNDVNTKWIMKVYPRGCKTSQPGFISVWLVNESYVKVKAEVKLFRKKFGKNEFLSVNDDISPGWAWGGEFRSKDNWLHNGDLILLCELSLVETGYDLRGSHNAQMLIDLELSFKDSLGFDVTVNCGETSFECNKFMLMSRSSVFKSMFQSNMVESQSNIINIVDLEPEVVAEMVKYIHTGRSPDIEKMPRELLAAADRYQLEQLKISCQEVLITSLNVENCISILILSNIHNALKLRKGALKFTTENMKAISSSCDWKKELAAFPSLMADMIDMFTTISDSLRNELESRPRSVSISF